MNNADRGIANLADRPPQRTSPIGVPQPRRLRRRAVAMAAAAIGLAGAMSAGVAAGQPSCAGDCNGSATVTVNELIQGVNIALGSAPLTQCASFDADGDGSVEVNELIVAVGNALNGCPPAPPTSTSTATMAIPTSTATPSAVPPTSTATPTTANPTSTATPSAAIPTSTTTATPTSTSIPTTAIPTPATATPTSTVAPTQTHIPAGTGIQVGTAAGALGETVEIAVRLTSDTPVAGVQNDILFSSGVFIPEVPIAERTCRQSGTPCTTDFDCPGGDRCKVVDCDVNPAIEKWGSGFTLQPLGCAPGLGCTGMRALVLSFFDVDPIASGSILYTCRVEIAADAPLGFSPLTCSMPAAASPEGDSLPVDCSDGYVDVQGAPAGTSLRVGSAAGARGDSVDIGVRLVSDTAVAGTENEIVFGPGVFVSEVPVGERTCRRSGNACVTDVDCPGGDHCKIVDCAVNPAIDKWGTAFALQPTGCAPGVGCTGVRSLVLSLENVDPIASGSTLYTCRVHIAADAPLGNSPLTCDRPGASTPDGEALPVDCYDGHVEVRQGTPSGVEIQVGSAAGGRGETVEIGVRVFSDTDVAGTQNDIVFGPGVFIPEVPIGERTCRRGGNACTDDSDCLGFDQCKDVDCDVNPDIDKWEAGFALQPVGCTAGDGCTGLRALVLSFDNVDPIPTGSTLYTCRVQIAGDAPLGPSPLTCEGAGAATPDGGALSTVCADGLIEVQ